MRACRVGVAVEIRELADTVHFQLRPARYPDGLPVAA